MDVFLSTLVVIAALVLCFAALVFVSSLTPEFPPEKKNPQPSVRELEVHSFLRPTDSSGSIRPAQRRR